MKPEEVELNHVVAKSDFLEDCLRDISLTLRMDVRTISIEEPDGSSKSVLAIGWFVDPRVSGKLPPLSELSDALGNTFIETIENYLDKGFADKEDEEGVRYERREVLPEL